ncbi:Outer membrane receptor for ferrienterochelin and colicins [Tenacibaculum sp. MAR_2009_124]|uniref:TonB-dependent receptor n=1 Tax=Tenacibaculum sp. MAR_2009_124 TaxID=1250059 RepID=UPI0008946337|nr:TonB-dependent receptor [Tenacibaculum sp. MAR_2009_124]SEB43924.1 Outer membrane receptor for ferrienterochelin and colicins [Tenacibaculum sp. MAR_2009_124]
MKFKLYVLILYFLISFVNQAFGQDNNSKKSFLLRDYLLKIESAHKVKFSYSDVVIQNKYVSTDNSTKEISVILNQLREETSLNFEILKDRYIIISEYNLKKDYKLCGNIFDEKDGKIIEGANVLIKRLKRGVSSSSKGFFGLNEVIESDSISISYVGYESKVIPFKDFQENKCLEILLKKEITVLEEVLVSDYLSGGIDKQLDGAIVISPQKLGAISGLTEPDVLQTIQFLPGINNPNETASDLFIRGGTPEQNLILFDGIKMYNFSHLFGMISAFNPYIISDVKIYKSGTSSEYGNHISGVVDIETKKQIPNKVQGGLGVNMTHFDAFVNIPLGKRIGVVVSGRKSLSDIFETPTFDNFSKKVFQNSVIANNAAFLGNNFENENNFYFFDFNTKFTYDLSHRDVVTFNYLLVRNKLNYFFNTIDSDAYITRDFLSIRNTGWRLKWDHDWSDNTIQKTSIYSSEYDFTYNYEGEFNYDEPYTQNAFKTNFIRDFGFKTTVETKTNDKTTFLSGYELVNNRISYKIQRQSTAGDGIFYMLGDTENNNTHSLFFNYAYNNKSKTVLNLGLRANYFSLADKGYFAPRLHMEQQILPNWHAKTSYEFKQQVINQLLENHTSDFGLEDQIWLLIDNKELPVLRNHQYTIGAIYKSDKTIFDIDFYKKHSLGISSYTRGTIGGVQNLLEGTGEVDGVDILLKKSFGKYDSWINYSYAKSTYTFEEANGGNPFPSNYDITNSFQWAHNLKFGNLSLSLAWLYKTGTPYSIIDTVEDDGTIVIGELNSYRLPDYHRVDISSSYEFSFDKYKRWKGRIGVSLLNVYDRTNILNRRHTVVSENSRFKVQPVDNLSLGFTPNVVLRLFLK